MFTDRKATRTRRTRNLAVSPFSQRFQDGIPGAGRTKSKQGGVMNPKAQDASLVPRRFAEFPYSVSCQEVGIHIGQLYGATFKGFLGDGETTCLRFELEGEDFTVEERSGRLVLVAENPDCRDDLLHEIQSHFAALLTPHMSE